MLTGALLVIAGTALLAARDLRRFQARDRDVADRSEMLELAGEIAQARPHKRSQVHVGEMGKQEGHIPPVSIPNAGVKPE